MIQVFDVRVSEAEHGTCVVGVRGELDLATAPQLKWTLVDLLDAGRRRIVVDLTELDFIDSTALGVLVAAARNSPEDTRFAVASERSAVLQIFEVTGLDSGFALFPTVGDAVAFVAGLAPDSR